MNDTPAFPTPVNLGRPDFHGDQTISSSGGLTKREYFAGLAMQGGLAGGMKCDASGSVFPLFAKTCVNFADALIAELEK